MPTETGFAEVNGTRLYYEAAGDGEPLVLIHGFTLDARMWDGQFAAFARRYRVIRYDARGFGQSALPGEPYGHHDDLKALLVYLGVPAAHVLGLSMGGGIAVDFTIAYPAAVRTLTLVDSTLDAYKARRSQDWKDATQAMFAATRAMGVEAGKERWLAHPLFAATREQPAAYAHLRRIVSGYSGWHLAHRDASHGLDPPAAQRLGEIAAPVLIIVGERDEAGFHAIADTLAQEIAHARKIVMSGVGHMPNMEAPEVFNEIVLDFLREARRPGATETP